MTTNSTPSSYVAYQVTVRGRVQGVGFRFFTRQHANQIGLAGWVRNTPTGNVKIFIQGPQSDVDTFLKHIQQGPSSAHVTDLELNQKTPNPALTKFDVKF